MVKLQSLWLEHGHTRLAIMACVDEPGGPRSVLCSGQDHLLLINLCRVNSSSQAGYGSALREAQIHSGFFLMTCIERIESREELWDTFGEWRVR